MSDGRNSIPWSHLRSPAGSLADTRLQVHRAAQVVASVGAAHVAPRPDDSHRNLEWLADPSVLAGNPAGTDGSFRLALKPGSFELQLLDATAAAVAQKPLTGTTLADGYRWAEEQIAAHTDSAVVSLVPPEYELPDHPVAAGAGFSADPTELQIVSDWYANAAAALQDLAGRSAGASPVRCWPHHFDIATLITLETQNPDDLRTVGIGMTPGDGTYAEPYWYVSPWPYPVDAELPRLAVGHWHTEGWIGAVLEAGELLQAPAAESQRDRLVGFLDASLTAAKSLLA